MKKRCHRKRTAGYKDYGARGIFVCEEWLLLDNPNRKSFEITQINKNIIESFIQWALNNGWHKGLTIDRKDNDKGYSPDNCRWITPQKQALHRRKRCCSSSRFWGVVFDKHHNNWLVQLYVNSQCIKVGYFKKELDAAKAYNDYVIENNLDNHLNCFTEEELNTTRQYKKIKSSKYSGVSYIKSESKWQAYVMVNQKKISLGRFKIEEEAAKVYNQYIIKHNLNKKLNNLGELQCQTNK